MRDHPFKSALAGNADRFDFDSLFHTFRPLVYSTALAVLHHREEAEDVVQDVFLKIWLRPQAPPAGHIDGWIVVVAKNAARDAIRRRPPNRTASPVALATLPGHDDVEGEVMRSCSAELLVSAVTRLPARQRALLIQSFWSRSPHSTIARTAALPLGTVKTRIRSAICGLRADSGVAQLA